MATKILTYYIGLTDPALVEQMQTTQHMRFDGRLNTQPGIIFQAPLAVSIAEGAPIKGWTQPAGPGPYTYSQFFDPQAGGKDGAFPIQNATFTRKAGGFWGWLGFGDTKFFWAGQYILVPGEDLPPDEEDPDDDANPDTPAPIPPETPIVQRRWVDGFEAPGAGAGGSGSAGTSYASPAASRHMAGLGLALRSATTTQTLTHAANEYGLANGASDWERLYIRVQRRPSGGSGRFWKMEMSGGSSGAGISLEIMPSGAIAIYGFSATSTFALLGATLEPLELNEWYRLDMTYTVPPIGGSGATAEDGSFALYINGRSAFSGAIPSSYIGHLTTTGAHNQSVVGSTVNINGLEIDLDDWICVAGVPLKTSKDWRNGSAVIPVRAKAFGAGHDGAAWPGDIRVLAQRPLTTSGSDQWLTSNTALGRLEIETDAEQSLDALPGSIGIAAMAVGHFGTRGSTNGEIGYNIAAGGDVLAAVTQQVTANWSSVLFTISGTTDLVHPAGPLLLIHTKGNDVSNGTTYSMIGQAECIGRFGPEDGEDLQFAEPLGLHNYPYPGSPWTVRGAAPPTSPVAIYSGAYTGNGTAVGVGGHDLDFPVPIHWLFIRPLTGTPTGTTWWSTLLGSHVGNQQSVKAASLPVQFLDPDFVPVDAEDTQQMQARVRISGNNAQVNANGVVYQYIAIADPGMRFMLNGAIAHRVTDTIVNALVNGNFLPELGWFFAEDIGSTSTVKKYLKGPANTADGYQTVAAAEATNAISFALGELETQSAFHEAVNQVAFSLFRHDDGSDDPGVYDVIAIGSYTGDGAASRTIGVSPASTKSPLFAHVQSRTAPSGGYYRDPSHTGSNSTSAGGSNSTTAITGGSISSFTVGSTLNAAGQVYNYFIVWGAANPGGWSPAPVVDDPPIEFIPVEPDVPTDPGPYPTTPNPDEDPGIDPDEPEPGEFEPGPGLEDDLAEGLCADTTIETMNLALSRVGVSQHVTDPLTDETLDAHLVAEHWNEAVLQTLRDYPWPFSTKYAALTVVAGSVASPVNGDWTFSYRKPGDCVFERRLVVDREDAVDPKAPPFALGFDATGGLIYTNQASAVLEYTARPACVAMQADPLFRDALAWKLASMIGPPLSRMPEVSANAATMYVQAIANAERVLRLGKPGSPPAASAVDVDEACQAANTEVANLSLIRIGAQTIADLANDQGREGVALRAIFEQELRATLRDFPWPFATEYIDGPTLVGGTDADPVNADWQYSFRLPADYVFARRLVTSMGRAFEPNPFPFKVGRDATGDLLFTDEPEPILEYTARRECAVAQADPLFKDAFAWRLAASLSFSLAQVDPDTPEQQGRGPEPLTRDKPASAQRSQLRDRMTRYAWGQYYVALDKARVAAANEQQRDPEQGDAPWIRARGGSVRSAYDRDND